VGGIAGIAGIAFGTLFMAFHATQGPVLGLPQMVQSRTQVGYRGRAALVGTLFTYVGFNVVDVVIIKPGLESIFGRNSVLVAIAITVIAALLATFGHDLPHRRSRTRPASKTSPTPWPWRNGDHVSDRARRRHSEPRYAEPSTFARLPRIDEVAAADVSIVGIPFDSGVSYRPGARFGPVTYGPPRSCCGRTTRRWPSSRSRVSRSPIAVTSQSTRSTSTRPSQPSTPRSPTCAARARRC
jgi:Permease for cytosine/purines, uracil, thiamine, allantoin/Arginase family